MNYEHLGGAYPQGDANTFMPDVWGYLVVKYQVASMLDLGCGYGHAMEWFNRLLVRVKGVEGDPEAVRGTIMPGCILAHDYNTGPAALGEDQFDLGWASEFVEHVDEQYMPNYMADLKRCRVVCITHAEPGQGGHHHVNLKSDHYWTGKFSEHGFVFNPSGTALLRATDRWKAGWGRRTLMLFENPLRGLEPPKFTPLQPIYESK
jgi:hypothetical protein